MSHLQHKCWSIITYTLTFTKTNFKFIFNIDQFLENIQKNKEIT